MRNAIVLVIVVLTAVALPTDSAQMYVDCTAAGVRATVPRPLFEDARIHLEYVTVGIIPWSASTVGYIEATRENTAEKNRLCPPVVFTGRSADLLHLARAGMTGMLARRAEADFAAPRCGTSNGHSDPRFRRDAGGDAGTPFRVA